MGDLIGFDSARWQLIPHYAEVIFPYADGRYAWSNSRFPHARYRYITITGNPAVDIADFEPGCIWDPKILRAWALTRLHRGLDVTVYTFREAYPIVAEALNHLEWHLFLATLDGTKLTSFDGKPLRANQYTDRGGLFDMSIVYDEGWLLPAPSVNVSPQYINVEVGKWSDGGWNTTLTGIASHFGIPLSELETANPQIRNPNLIYPGEIIKVP